MVSTKIVGLLLGLALCLNLAESINAGENDKCRILALEGGGDKGSYEVGALKAFMEFMSTEEVQYDIVTGVSIGSVNALGISLHAIGEEDKCIDWMQQLWMNITQKDVFQSWPLGIPQGLLFEEGLFDNRNEMVFIRNFLAQFKDKKVKRGLSYHTCDFNTGKVVVYDENEPWDTIPEKVVASTSMPFAFTHMHYDNSTYVDGGSVWNLDISGAVDKCLKTHKEEDIILDVIMCDGFHLGQDEKASSYNTFENFDRYRAIKSYYHKISDLEELIRGYPKVNVRHLVHPEKVLPSGKIPIGFNHDKIMEMMQTGYDNAKSVIEDGNDIIETLRTSYVDKLMSVYDPAQTARFLSKH